MGSDVAASMSGVNFFTTSSWAASRSFSFLVVLFPLLPGIPPGLKFFRIAQTRAAPVLSRFGFVVKVGGYDGDDASVYIERILPRRFLKPVMFLIVTRAA